MYNKLEALREKGEAEKMMASKDYVGAREKLLKAQQLFPALDHIVAMLTVCDILSAATNRIPGYGSDHYWVLHIMPSSSAADVKHQYNKLLILLQPIKGKFFGTELALNLIQEAFSVLSDRTKRLIFDSERSASWADYESFSVQEPFHHGMPSKETDVSAQFTPVHEKVSSLHVWDGNNVDVSSMHMHQERVEGFGPKRLANFDGKKQNANISPQESSSVSSDIISEDIELPGDDLNSSVGPPIIINSDSSCCSTVVHKKLVQDYYNFGDNRAVECFKIGQIWAVENHLQDTQTYCYAQINTISKSAIGIRWLKPIPIGKSERRWCDASLPVACGSFCLDLDLSEQVSSPTAFLYNCRCVPGVTEDQFEIYPRKGEVWALYEDWDLDEWSYNPETIGRCTFKLIEILSDFSKYVGAKGAYLLKVDGFKSVYQRETKEGNPVTIDISPRYMYMLSHNVPAYKFTGGEIDGVVSGMLELDQFALSGNKLQDFESHVMPKKQNFEDDFTIPLEPLAPQMLNSEKTVLGPKWSLNDFATGQIWAVYCGKYLMPRKYARIDGVISGSEVHITFLDPQPIFDYQVTWKKEQLPIVCGIFQPKETTVKLRISQLSHLVKCQMSTTRPMYKIFPMKGEVWAMYQNWSSEWRLPDYENHRCWVVEILSDFTEEGKMMVARLGEVKGCLTFFQRSQRDGFDMSRAVSKTEMLAFSHQIPAFRVPGIGRYGIPESCWHLEPTALPSHRLI